MRGIDGSLRARFIMRFSGVEGPTPPPAHRWWGTTHSVWGRPGWAIRLSTKYGYKLDGSWFAGVWRTRGLVDRMMPTMLSEGAGAERHELQYPGQPATGLGRLPALPVAGYRSTCRGIIHRGSRQSPVSPVCSRAAGCPGSTKPPVQGRRRSRRRESTLITIDAVEVGAKGWGARYSVSQSIEEHSPPSLVALPRANPAGDFRRDPGKSPRGEPSRWDRSVVCRLEATPGEASRRYRDAELVVSCTHELYS